MEGCYVWLLLLLSTNVWCMRNERERGVDPDDAEFLVQILKVKAVELGKLLQSGRAFLHKIREWHGAHPAESVLAKCVLHYWIEDTIPVIVATAEDDEIGRRGLSTPVWIERYASKDEPQLLPNLQDPNPMQDISYRILDNGEFNRENIQIQTLFNDDEKLKFKRKVVKALYLLYMELRDLLTEHKLIGCSVHYLITKFWEWVDNAP